MPIDEELNFKYIYNAIGPLLDLGLEQVAAFLDIYSLSSWNPSKLEKRLSHVSISSLLHSLCVDLVPKAVRLYHQLSFSDIAIALRWATLV